MTEQSKIKGFPDISNKLGAPTKKSLFERQKAEAEAKRQREQEETAAVYEDFVKSFDDDGGDTSTASIPTRGNLGGGGGFSKRHFSGSLNGPGGRGGISGRGTSGPGSLGPPPLSISRKRPYDGSEPTRREGLFAFEDGNTGPADPKTALQHSDDEEAGDESKVQERAVPKPTLRLSSLPPGTSPAVIKAIIPSTLAVEGVRILPPSGPGTNSMERRAGTAIVTLAKETPALDIDTVVSALQNRYMGRGYYLSLSRHLSSASVGIDVPALGFSANVGSLPFGARPVPQSNLGRAPSSSVHRGGFAPPTSYSTPQGQNTRGTPQLQVTVTPPTDLKQLKMIHKTLEALINHGPEFEALLMSRKEVQLDEKWAWLWDSRSVGGVYYRWRLWDILTGSYRRRTRSSGSVPQYIFENGAAWVGPEQKLSYEYTTCFDELVSDSDYDSSEDEDSGDEGRRRYAHHHGGALPPDAPNTEAENQNYLNPLQKAKLTHLLARLPTTNAKLRRGDVARVTAFAIQHAGEGAEETVQMIVHNAQQPLAFTSANPNYQPSYKTEEAIEPDDGATPNDSTPNPTDKPKGEVEDTIPAKLVGLYVISDILSSSSTSGVRHAWRYRQLFETAFKRQNTFVNLGRLEKNLNWGRLRAEKWKRSVNSILSLWEGWCVFPQESQERFSRDFNDPPLTKQEEAAKREAEEEERRAEKAKKRWKTVDEKAAERAAESEEEGEGEEGVREGEEMEVDTEAMDFDIDGEAMMENEDVDGVTMADSDDAAAETEVEADVDSEGTTARDEEEDKPAPVPAVPDRRAALAASIAAKLGKSATLQASAAPPDADAAPSVVRKRQRPKAEDMFASDEE